MDSPQDAAQREDDSNEALIVEALERITAGESDVVERLCAEHPERAEELRERVKALAEMNLLPADAGANAFPEQLGEFRLLRRLGGGGMGVVYEAKQERLGRVVALKLIRPEHLYFERSRERFRRECEAVARLSHPGIVTIHTVGEAGGAPYFAMEMIRGATLAQVIEHLSGLAPESLTGADLQAAVAAFAEPVARATPEREVERFAGSWVDACARIVLAMTEALSHAHERGVLHRDVKPSNIAVTTEGRVVLLDFGLAALEDELRLTTSGSALGSVLYMAPEQVEGRISDIGVRTDVYALGITLYELLTLQAPFAGADSAHTRAAILEGQPASIRARHRGVSRDLEIVCLHAIERDPARRYATMADFGADLANVLAGRPIHARPPSTLYRARRWTARHPATSTAIALGTLLVTLLPTALYFQQRANSRELARSLEEESRARQFAADESRRATGEAETAESVSRFLVSMFAASDPYAAGRRDLTARELLDDGVLRVERDLADRPEVQARLYERIGESYTNLDLPEQALVPLDRAVALRRELHGASDPRTAAAMVLLGSASRLAHRGDAFELLDSAVSILDAYAEAPTEARISAWSLLAMCYADCGDAAHSIEYLSRAREHLDEVTHGRRAMHWSVLAMLASAHTKLGELEKAESVAREALALDREIDTGANPWRVAALGTLALVHWRRGELEEALETYDAALPLALEFYGEDNVQWAMVELNRASVAQDLGLHEGLLDRLGRSFAVLYERSGFADDHASTAALRLASELTFLGRFDDARELLRRGRSELEAAGKVDDRFRALFLARSGQVLRAAGDHEAAAADLRLAKARETPLDADTLAAFDVLLAHVLLGNEAHRAEALELARAWSESPLREIGTTARFALAKLALFEDRRDDAREHLRAAIECHADSKLRSWAVEGARELLAELDFADAPTDENREALRHAFAKLRIELGDHHHDLRAARERIVALGLDPEAAASK